ncbi:hypothetical protein HRD57_03325 [Tetragenococcus halophilus]|nr:hypothetical protein [Tetragenococcus halophilus]
MSEIDFLNIQINEEALESQIIEQIKLKIKAFDDNKIFYDLDDLVTITSFSKGHIMNTFFNDPRFLDKLEEELDANGFSRCKKQILFLSSGY